MKPEIRKALVVEFTKMTGAGNDFIVLDNRFFRFTHEELSKFAIKYCPRRSAVGADGLLALEDSSLEGCDFRMVYYNADGSRGSMCGNGARCLARFAVMTGFNGPRVRFETDAGPYHADVPRNMTDSIRLFFPPHRNFRPACDRSSGRGRAGDPVDFIWTGTEHIVVFVDDVEDVRVDSEGASLRNDTGISAIGANVNFVQLLPSGEEKPARIRVRTYERGVEAETDACGTGAVATAMVAAIKGLVDGPMVQVEMNGGVLTVSYTGSAANPTEIVLEGAADLVFRGTIDVWFD